MTDRVKYGYAEEAVLNDQINFGCEVTRSDSLKK